MNPRILLAFVGGVAVAGVLAYMLVGQGEPKPGIEGQPVAQTQSAVVEQPVSGANGNAADVAAGMEPVRPSATGFVRKSGSSLKPTVAVTRVAKKNSAGEPGTTASASDQGVMLPPFSSSGSVSAPKAASSAAEEPKRAEILRPDPVAKPVAARVPETVTIPAGTSISVRIDSTLSTEKNVTGDSFTASLDAPLVVNDIVLAERGAKVDGKIVEADKSGRVRGVAKLSIELTRIQLSDGQHLELKTDPWERDAESTKKADAVKVGVMAGIGAAIGAIAGGGKGAVIGGASGGAAGTGVVLATRGKPAQIDVETKIPFRLSNALSVTEKIR